MFYRNNKRHNQLPRSLYLMRNLEVIPSKYRLSTVTTYLQTELFDPRHRRTVYGHGTRDTSTTQLLFLRQILMSCKSTGIAIPRTYIISHPIFYLSHCQNTALKKRESSEACGDRISAGGREIL